MKLDKYQSSSMEGPSPIEKFQQLGFDSSKNSKVGELELEGDIILDAPESPTQTQKNSTLILTTISRLTGLHSFHRIWQLPIVIYIIVASIEHFSSTSGKKWLSWSSTSEELLKESEENILAYLTTPYNKRHVDIGKVVGETDSKIWTISFNENSDKTPLVLLHGMGAGVALWILNLDELAEDRPVYAIDLLGFGRSSRPTFSSDPWEAEAQMASSIEAWRLEMKLEKFVILGHSLGGYISTAYALRYPAPVSHLILADPWGFQDTPTDYSQIGKRRIPLPVRVLARLFEPLNPLWAFRLVGPKLIQKMRPDIIRKYEHFLDGADIKISHYMYHCNAQNPTGESGFHTLMYHFAWAKNPMSRRISLLDPSVPITFLYGSNSWIDHVPTDKLKELRGAGCYCEAHILEGAGHHVYADTKETFNGLVLSVCSTLDK